MPQTAAQMPEGMSLPKGMIRNMIWAQAKHFFSMNKLQNSAASLFTWANTSLFAGLTPSEIDQAKADLALIAGKAQAQVSYPEQARQLAKGALPATALLYVNAYFLQNAYVGASNLQVALVATALTLMWKTATTLKPTWAEKFQHATEEEARSEHPKSLRAQLNPLLQSAAALALLEYLLLGPSYTSIWRSAYNILWLPFRGITFTAAGAEALMVWSAIKMALDYQPKTLDVKKEEAIERSYKRFSSETLSEELKALREDPTTVDDLESSLRSKNNTNNLATVVKTLGHVDEKALWANMGAVYRQQFKNDPNKAEQTINAVRKLEKHNKSMRLPVGGDEKASTVMKKALKADFLIFKNDVSTAQVARAIDQSVNSLIEERMKKTDQTLRLLAAHVSWGKF